MCAAGHCGASIGLRLGDTKVSRHRSLEGGEEGRRGGRGYSGAVEVFVGADLNWVRGW